MLIVKTLIECIRQSGARPFVVPAMGSHGGATAQGQIEVLASYGITEKDIGAPVRSSMEVVELTDPGDKPRVFMDRSAFESDGVVIVNRVKPHTDFHGPFESGLAKMLTIGLGKHAQALELHDYGVFGLRELMPKAAARVLATGKIMAALAIIENQLHQTMHVEAVMPENILNREPQLLEIARANMPRLPVEELDVLIIDKMGKDINGVGVDPNVIGRTKIRGETEPLSPRIKNIVIADISDESHGNALGMGLGDIITRRLFSKIDFAYTYENVYTATFLERAKIPIIAETDREALKFALRGCGHIEPGHERIIRMRDTLHTTELYVSPAVLSELQTAGNCQIIEEPGEFFDELGAMRAF